MVVITGLLLLLATASVAQAAADRPPPWTKDLTIYQVNPRAYTSPNGVGDGHGSGTFDSLAERMPYLEKLGINAVWMSGFQLANDHFYGIWSNYAVINPRIIDPVLGTEQDFKELIDTAHRHGIRVFLDVISHGVVNDSPLVEEHPDWFIGRNQPPWNMADYDYANPEFRKWWIDTWVDYATRFGVDGYRVDVNLEAYSPADPRRYANGGPWGVKVWDEITERMERAGKPIVVYGETEDYQFGQHTTTCGNNTGNDGFPYDERRHRCTTDVPGDFARTTQRFTTIQLSCHDEGYLAAKGDFHYFRANGSRYKFAYAMAFAPRIPVFFGGEEFNARQVQLPEVEMGLYGGGPTGAWLYAAQIQWSDLEDPERAAMLRDVQTIFAIKRRHPDLLHADREAAKLVAVLADGEGPKPYARFEPGREAIVVAGNDTRGDVERRLTVPLKEMGLDGRGRYRVTDLATGESEVRAEAELADLPVRIGADYTPGGGYRALKVEPVAEPLVSGLPQRGRCASRRRFAVHLAKRIRTARVTVGGRRVAVRRRKGRLVATVDLRGRGAGRVAVRIVGRTKGGKPIRERRVFRTCATKRA
jgi:hypothetical protein